MHKLKKSKKPSRNFFFLITFLLVKISTYTVAIDLKGNFIQGGLLIGKVFLGDTVYYNEKEVPVDEAGEFIIGLGRTHPNIGIIKIFFN